MHTDTTAEHKYILINYDKPEPIIKPKPVTLTEYEAHTLNRGFAFNRLAKRYIKNED
tara:strand:- start:2101 stop:2271 length:171 start_codon:yes stop_codon:yes gene_type:complete